MNERINGTRATDVDWSASILRRQMWLVGGGGITRETSNRGFSFVSCLLESNRSNKNS